MKKQLSILFLITIGILQSLFAQSTKKIKPEISVWNISDKTTAIIPTKIDTSVFNFQSSNKIDKYSIANAYNGTLGSPLQSKIYSDRTQKTDFLFSLPYDAYFLAPTEILFYNTKTPYSNLTYYSSGGQQEKEDDFNAVFTVNVNKRLNFGGLINYAEARGMYSRQSTQQFKGGLYFSYLGKWYNATGIAMYQGFNNQENGGIQDIEYITRPDSLTGYEPVNIPVKLSDAKSKYSNKYLYFNQKINIGRGRNAADSITKDTIRVATLSHTLKLEQAQKKYKANYDRSYYTNTYFDSIATMDSTRYRSFRNNVAITINEGFSKWFPLGITAYIEDDYQEYFNLNDTIPLLGYENDILIGAEMAKRKGKAFLFTINGELNTIGRKAGDFNLNGAISSSFRLFKDTVSLKVNGFMRSTSPSYFENKYISNHFIWNNNFDKTLKTNVDASLGLKNKWLNLTLGAAVQNINNLIYFDDNALPMQHTGDIQLLIGNASLNLKLGPLYIQNMLVYQKASDESVLPLPEISTYNNVFFGFKMFKKVLTTQLGTDMYYHTAYYAPNYMPATGVFYLQKSQLIGNYPLISVYANFHLKTASFFIKYSHISALFVEPNYFSMPNYPLYSNMFRIGITWNFFD